jgi:hypothetical protein
VFPFLVMPQDPTMPDPQPPVPNDPSPLQRFAHNPTSARVPEKVARGVTATGFLAFFGPNEFVVDFLQFIARPAHLVARVVMSPAVAEQFLNVLRENLSHYQTQFGTPPTFPKPQGEKPRAAQEIYDDLKISDEALTGVYANTVMVGHTPAEFGIDFITSFIPHAAVSARIYVAAPRVPQLIETLSGLVAQYKRQHGPATPPPPAGGGPQMTAGGPGPANYGTAPGVPGFPTPPSPPSPPTPPPGGPQNPPPAGPGMPPLG